MDFKTLHGLIPYAYGGKKHVLEYRPYNGILLKLPGRHALDTVPQGGDFVVCVDDENAGWVAHQFTHVDLFKDLDAKANEDGDLTSKLMDDYYSVIIGKEPAIWTDEFAVGIHPQTFLYAVQSLSVAEHRRYAHYESKFGGRYLPFRFAAGIVDGRWTAEDAAAVQKYGRPAVERLEKKHGVPQLTEVLMK